MSASKKKDTELSSRLLDDFEPPQLLKEMTSSKAFRCVQAWLLEKPAAWADDPCLAAAQMAQRPPAKRPREDALLEAERSHQRRRIELLEEQLLALRWFEAHDTWSGRWDAWDAVLDHGGPPEPPARPDVKKLVSEWQAELSETS